MVGRDVGGPLDPHGLWETHKRFANMAKTFRFGKISELLEESLTANSLSGSFSPFLKGREYWKRSTSLVL